MYRLGDQRWRGLEDCQNDNDDERELEGDDVDEDDASPSDSENLEVEERSGVASSLGDLGGKASLDGELNSFHTVDSRKPMAKLRAYWSCREISLAVSCRRGRWTVRWGGLP